MFIKLANLVLYVTRVINMNFLSTISVHRQQKTLWELINRSLMGNAFILSYRILSTDPLRKCTDIGVENLYVDTGAWRVKETSGRRGLANPPLVLATCEGFYIWGADPGNFVANYFSDRDNYMFLICERRLPSFAREIPTAMRAEVIIGGYPKTVTIFNIPGI